MDSWLKNLSDEQIDFICNELRFSKEDLYSMDEDMLYDKVYDPMCDIEIAEIPSDDSEETEHCRNVSEIVTVMGNKYAVEE